MKYKHWFFLNVKILSLTLIRSICRCSWTLMVSWLRLRLWWSFQSVFWSLGFGSLFCNYIRTGWRDLRSFELNQIILIFNERAVTHKWSTDASSSAAFLRFCNAHMIKNKLNFQNASGPPDETLVPPRYAQYSIPILLFIFRVEYWALTKKSTELPELFAFVTATRPGGDLSIQY